MNLFTKFATTAVLATGLISASAQQNIEPRGTVNNPGNDQSTNYTHEQLVTATVHQAWLLSGKNEEKFFDMVQQLAELSAQNRNITLPDDAAAGRRMGDYIKRTAKLDTDQLLYAVVDKAVLMISHAPAHPAGQKR